MDSIGDLLTQIRNASSAGLPSINTSYSKMRVGLLKILKANHYIADFVVSKESPFRIEIVVAYEKDGANALPKIAHIKRISKPGRRVYVNHLNIPRPLRGIGLVVISTPQGVISGRDAFKQHLGGELICEVW